MTENFSTTERWTEASRSQPCPLCQRDHYCGLLLNDKEEPFKIVCQWTEVAQIGWERTGTAKDGRPIFTKEGHLRTKRRNFPDFLRLTPKAIPGDIPQWGDVSGDRGVWLGDLVYVKPEVGLKTDSVYEVIKTYPSKRGVMAIAKQPNSPYSAELEILADDLILATVDPATGAKEQEIEYLYTTSDGTPIGKVVRRQWTDRRPAYEKSRRKTKHVRPYYWADGTDGDFWKQGKGDRQWPLYREDEAKDEILRGGVVFAVAGEQAVETYRLLGLVATTCQGGESNFEQILDRLDHTFKLAKENGSKPVLVIHPDHDLTGETKFTELLRLCSQASILAVMLNPLDVWNAIPIGGDIHDMMYRSELTPATLLSNLEASIDQAIDRQENEILFRLQRARWNAPEAYRGELGYWREDKESDRRWFQPQCDFDFQIERELISEDGGGLVLQIKRADENRQRRVYLKSAEYSSPQTFVNALKKSLGGGVICNLQNPGLQALIRVRLHEYRITRQGKAYRLIDRIGQQPDGTWVFEYCQFTKDGEPTTEDKSLWVWNPEITGNNTHFKPPSIAPYDPAVLPRFVGTMQQAFGSNFPLAQLALGYVAAACHYQEIQAKSNGFPILNLYGDPGSGKTAAARCALALVGQHDEGIMSEVSVSAAYQRLKLAGGLLHCLDDPKRDDNLDEFLKAFYNGQPRVVRGKDNEGFNTQKPHSPLMVTSNHACGESSAATQSRLARLFFPKVRDGSEQAFNEIDFGEIREQASGCFTQLIKIGYPIDEIRELEIDLAQHLPNAHSRIAKSLSLILCYAMKVAELAELDPQPLKQYVIDVICAQVNDPDESGDSLRDFFEKVFSLQSESKVGEWNCRWVEKRDGKRSLAVYLPGVWTALDKNFNPSYNRKIIENLVLSRGITKTRQNFHADEDQSRAYNRAKLTADSVEAVNPPERITRFCYELPEELLKEYSEKSEGRSSRSSDFSLEVETLDSPEESLMIEEIIRDHQRSTEVDSPTPVDLFTPPVDQLMIEEIISPNSSPPIDTGQKVESDDLDDQQIENGRASWFEGKKSVANSTLPPPPHVEEQDLWR